MGGRGRSHGQGPATSSETRPEAPAPDKGAGKSSKSSKRRKNRHGKRRNRQQSFLTPHKESDDRPDSTGGSGGARESMEGDRPTSKDNPLFFKLGRNLSNTSIESDALLDHR